MMPPILWRTSFEGTLLLLAFAGIFTRMTMAGFAKLPLVKWGFALLSLVLVGSHLLWLWGPTNPSKNWGCTVACYSLLLLLFLAASLPFAALVRLGAKRALKVKAIAPDAPRPVGREITRRTVLNAATAVVPLVAVSVGARGFINGVALPELPRILLSSPTLPAALEGLMILQLSDLHLGVSRHVKDLERFVDRLGAQGISPDLIVFTGDLADDLGQIVPAFRAVERLKPRLGIHSSIGNHEYLHGIREARAQYDRAHSNLLMGQGTSIRVKDAVIHLAGADDPLSVDSEISGFMRRTTEQALRDRPAGAYSVLLSHRPEGFVAAAQSKVDLTLSGHTHGGQIGFNGKSAFQPLFPDGYLWGRYQRGA
ncbi:MAG: metallophosphoesterase, partial [Polyangiaceae bacterium]